MMSKLPYWGSDDTLKACSDNPFLRIRFLVSKTGSRRSDGPISRFRFCGENVGRSFVVCSHDPFFRTNKESSICTKRSCKIVGAFHALFPSVFFKITDPFDRRSFLMCSHDPFLGTNKNRILKTDHVNGPLGLFCSRKGSIQ